MSTHFPGPQDADVKEPDGVADAIAAIAVIAIVVTTVSIWLSRMT